MKKAGIALLVIGLLITLVTSIQFITKEKVVDMGEIQISRNKKHSFGWSPLIGVAVMLVGGGVLLLGAKK